jgi:hypothetical protein
MPRLSSSSAMSAADRVAVPRSMHARQQPRHARVAGGSAAIRRDGQVDRHRGVVVVLAESTAPLSHRRVSDSDWSFSVSLQPMASSVPDGSGVEPATVRLRRQERRAAAPTSSSVTAAIRAAPRERLDACNRLEVAELMRDVGHAVAVEDEPRAQLRLRLASSASVMPSRQTRSSSSSSADSTDASGVRSVAVADTV